MKKGILAAVVLAAALPPFDVCAASPSLRILPVFDGFRDSYAVSVSGNGSAATGWCYRSTGEPSSEALVWTPEAGMTRVLPVGVSAEASAISSDGTTIVGKAEGPNGYQAFRWSKAAGISYLAPAAGWSINPIPSNVSADGSVVIGYDGGPSLRTGWYWTQATGMQAIPTPSGYTYWSRATDISADGRVLLCTAQAANTSGVSYLWTRGGAMTLIPQATGTWGPSTMSADGTVIVGTSYPDYHLVRWNSTGALEYLGQVAGQNESEPTAVSADGSVIVGDSFGGGNDRAFIWTRASGIKALDDYLVQDCHVDIGTFAAKYANDVSADGRTIVGWGVTPDGWRGYIATIPEPATLALLAAGGLAMLRRRRKSE